MTKLILALGLTYSPFGTAQPVHPHLSCEHLLNTAPARAARARAHAIFAAGDADDDVTVAYVGLSNGQLIELLNEGEIHADRWGDTQQYGRVLAGHPAVERLLKSRPEVEFAERNVKSQFEKARGDVWARSVVELMEVRHPNLRTDGFLSFLIHLRAELTSKTWADPTIDQITEATTRSDLPKARLRQHRQLRTLAKMLGVPWEFAPTQVGPRNRRIAGAFRDLPKDAGVVLALGERALDKLTWFDDGAGLLAILLDDIVGIEALALPEFQFMDGLKSDSIGN